MAKPEVGDILELDSQLESDIYGGISSLFRKDQRYYELDFLSELGLPTEFAADGIVLPTARDIVDVATDHTDISNARVSVNRKGITNVADEEAEMLRKFYLGVIYKTNTESPISPWRVGAKHYWLHGVTFFKTLWDADRWPNKPIQRSGESDKDFEKRITEWQGETSPKMPIVVQAVNPWNVRPDPDHISREFYIEKHEKTVFNMKRRYPKWSNPEGKQIGQDVVWTEYWDKDYKCFLADGEPVLPRGGVVKHNYGFLPYVEIDSGLGNQSLDSDIEMKWVGLLRYMFDILKSQSRNYSVSDVINMKGAWPWYGARDDQEGAKVKKLRKLDVSYGAVNDLTGIELEKMSPDQPADALIRHLALSDDIISSHSAPRSLRGLGETGVRSGSDRRLILAEAGMRYTYSKDAFKYGTAKVLTNCAKLYKNVIPSDIRLWNWSQAAADEFDEIIKRDKMKEPFTCYVEFAPISEEDEYRRLDSLERQVQTGLLTKHTARRQMTNIDPIAEDKQEKKDLIEQALIPVIAEYAKQKAGLQLQAKMAAQAPPPSQGPQGGLTTQSPPAVMPGSAQDLQRQIASQQRPPINVGQGVGGGGPIARTR